jgi:hypothetical protein
LTFHCIFDDGLGKDDQRKEYQEKPKLISLRVSSHEQNPVTIVKIGLVCTLLSHRDRLLMVDEGGRLVKNCVTCFPDVADQSNSW